MVDVKKEVKERLENARETVKGAKSSLSDVIAKAEKKGREQFQELVAMGEKMEPRIMEVLETRFAPIHRIIKDLNERFADKSAEAAEKPAAKKAAAKPAARKAAGSKATGARKTTAKKAAGSKATKSATAAKTTKTTRAKAAKPAEA